MKGKVIPFRYGSQPKYFIRIDVALQGQHWKADHKNTRWGYCPPNAYVVGRNGLPRKLNNALGEFTIQEQSDLTIWERLGNRWLDLWGEDNYGDGF